MTGWYAILDLKEYMQIFIEDLANGPETCCKWTEKCYRNRVFHVLDSSTDHLSRVSTSQSWPTFACNYLHIINGIAFNLKPITAESPVSLFWCDQKVVFALFSIVYAIDGGAQIAVGKNWRRAFARTTALYLQSNGTRQILKDRVTSYIQLKVFLFQVPGIT